MKCEDNGTEKAVKSQDRKASLEKIVSAYEKVKFRIPDREILTVWQDTLTETVERMLNGLVQRTIRDVMRK